MKNENMWTGGGRLIQPAFLDLPLYFPDMEKRSTTSKNYLDKHRLRIRMPPTPARSHGRMGRKMQRRFRYRYIYVRWVRVCNPPPDYYYGLLEFGGGGGPRHPYGFSVFGIPIGIVGGICAFWH